ncbi:MAG: acyltransferase domain-containing protein, partial [Gammaproteobacteria bacterium]|nr:acyltransferase domain-containing protein [Gammaproteobacteria bacterium]
PGRTGVYAGVGINTYLQHNLYANQAIMEAVDTFQLMLANDKDFLSTRVSYKLNLTGSGVNVQTACSSSLTAVHFACQGLLNGESDMALAGGVRVHLPQKAVYLHQKGGILSPDGHCRAFDVRAQGIVGGSGAGIVVLKRLSDALADGDTVHAVIKSTAINNDGAQKVGFTAPSVEGQAAVIADAQAIAGVDPDTVTYVEAHGTATELGDPIEIAALTQAFHKGTAKKNFCAIGSAKTNFGHLDAAAGVAALIKTVLALKHRQIPPSLHFTRPNPNIDLANSPFYVNTALTDWTPPGTTPRRAGVSSFGIGGTNAHAVLEEAPVAAYRETDAGGENLLLLSARTAAALDAAGRNLAEHLKRHPDINLSDAAYTLQTGRRDFPCCRMLVCRTAKEAVNALETLDARKVVSAVREASRRPAVFMFSGQGAQYTGMGRELYQTETVFRERIDICAEYLIPHLQQDIRAILYPNENSGEEAELRLKQTALTQPALFSVEYALAGLWMAWGIRPVAMIGHSIGEYVAACLAGVFSLKDALALVAARGRLMQQMPAGSMLGVALPEAELTPWLEPLGLSLAIINGPARCVASGTSAAITSLQKSLSAKGVECRPLHTSHAYHSEMMTPVLPPFLEEFKKIALKPPQIPYLSNVTGGWITPEQAMDPNYWAEHLRHTVRFADGLRTLFQKPEQVLLEVGPGRTLSTLAKQHANKPAEQAVFSSLRHPQDKLPDRAFILTSLGKLHQAGVPVDWHGFYAHRQCRRIPLPTYPFERERYWIEPSVIAGQVLLSGQTQEKTETPQAPISSHARPELAKSYAAPRNSIEEKIAEVWQQSLGIRQIGIADDFFELGGDSLQAIQVIDKLREILKLDLSQHSLLNAPTIAELAELAGNAPAAVQTADAAPETRLEEPESLVRIQAGDNRRQALYLVHPVGGMVYFYRDLARFLGAEQPVYGFQARGLDGKAEPLTGIEEMAAHYIEALVKVQTDGPYLLGGSSFGGIVAFEMALQLRAQGREVTMIVMIDAPGPGQLPAKLEDDAAVLVYLADSLLDEHSLTVEGLRQLETDEQLTYVMEHTDLSAHLSEFGGSLSESRRFLRVLNANLLAMFNYTPHRYPGPGRVVFFRAETRRPSDPPRPELPWIELAGDGMEIYIVPGDHISMNSPPHIQAITERLQNIIER